MRRVTDEMLNEVLIAASSCLGRVATCASGRRLLVPVDATELAPGAVSMFFINRRTDGLISNLGKYSIKV
jgi:hypothetical protein